MNDPVSVAIEGEVAVLRLSRAPGNALDLAMRKALFATLDRLMTDDDIQAVVLSAEGHVFSSGTPLEDLKNADLKPTTAQLCLAIEDAPKPVVAALFGMVQGGAVAVALAAHHRIAASGTRFMLPQVRYGLIPEAGVTQRLPRLVGAQTALKMVLGGDPIDAAAAFEAGLVDEITEASPMKPAMALAHDLAKARRVPVPARVRAQGLQDRDGFLAEVAAARQSRKAARDPAAARAIDCIEASLLLPPMAALDMADAAFEDLRSSSRGRAFVHLALAEQRAWRQADLVGLRPLDIRQVGIYGAALDGPDIAAAFLTAGFRVTMVDRDEILLETGVARVAADLERAVDAGRMSADAREAAMAAFSARMSMQGLAGADLVIEAGADTETAKRGAIGDLDGTAKSGAILASHGVDVDMDTLAAGTSRASDVIGLHFAAPATRRLVDIRPAAMTDPETIATLFQVVRRLGKIPLRAAHSQVPAGAQVMRTYEQAAGFLAEDGAEIDQIDAAMRGFGFRMGPFEAADAEGLEADDHWRSHHRNALHPDARYLPLADRLCQLGHTGRAVGRGYYLYDSQGARRGINPEATEILNEERLFHEVTLRAFTPEGIRRVCLLAMVSAGARLVEAGAVPRPSDIDLALVTGYGFPAARGGPLFWADQIGLLPLRSDLEGLEETDPYFWSQPPIIAELIRDGRRFGDLDAESA